MKNVPVALILISALVLPDLASAEENASNPLAATNSFDLRWTGTASGTGNKHDYWVDGAQMLSPDIKLKYEVHYNTNDFTGSKQSHFEKFSIKPMWFPYAAKLNEEWAVKATIGFDWIVDIGDRSKAIGIDADQIAPFGGLAFSHAPSGFTLIPLAQHFISYNGSTDVKTTSGRLIALQPFGEGFWLKADVKVPYDWINDLWQPTAEVQIGYNINKGTAVYVDGLVGFGNARPYDSGLGFGLRFKY